MTLHLASNRAAGPRSSTASRNELAICGFDHCSGVTIATIVVTRWTGGFQLLECHSLLDHVLNAVANDRDHVSILHDVGLIGQAAMAGNNHGAAFLPVFWNREIDD